MNRLILAFSLSGTSVFEPNDDDIVDRTITG